MWICLLYKLGAKDFTLTAKDLRQCLTLPRGEPEGEREPEAQAVPLGDLEGDSEPVAQAEPLGVPEALAARLFLGR
jgi:hypothetical protein